MMSLEYYCKVFQVKISIQKDFEMNTLLYYYFGININNFTLQIFELFNMIKNFKLLTLDSNNIKFKKTNFLCDDKTNY